MASNLKLKNSEGSTLTISNSDSNLVDKVVVYLSTVEELATVTGSNGDVAHVSDIDRGGIFVYDDTRVSENDGVSVFNGWVKTGTTGINSKYDGKSYKSTITACSLFAGLNETEIFTGSSNASQGLAYLNGKVYIKQKVSGTSNYNNELSRIVEYTYSDTEGYVYNNSFTSAMYISHQGLGVYDNGTDIIAISAYRTALADDGTADYGKGYRSINLTTEAITEYQLFGHSTSTHKYKDYYGATPTCSKDGKYIVISAIKKDVSSTNFVFVYNREEVENANNSLDIEPISVFSVLKPSVESMPLQDLTVNDKYIYLYYGYYNAINNHTVRIYDFNGVLVNEFKERHLLDTLGLDDDTYIYQSFEPEGIALNDNGELLLLCMKNKVENEDIVTFDGNNYACIADHTNKSPLLQDYWVKTDFSATSGTWDDSTAYDNGSYVLKDKVIVRVTYDSDGNPINTTTNFNTASLPLTSSSVDMAYEFGDYFQIKAYNEQTNTFFNAYQISRSSEGTKYKFYDNKELSDNGSPFTLDVVNNTASQVTYIRQNELQINGAGINLYGDGDTSHANELHLLSGGASGGIALKIKEDKIVELTNGLKLGSSGTVFNTYLEGDWSSSIEFADDRSGGNTFSATINSVKYIKVGSMVTLFVSVNNIVTSGATANANLYVRGLPFTPDTSFASPIGTCKLTGVTEDAVTNTSAVVRVSGDTLVFASYGLQGGTSSPYMDADWFASGIADIEFTLTYKAS